MHQHATIPGAEWHDDYPLFLILHFIASVLPKLLRASWFICMTSPFQSNPHAAPSRTPEGELGSDDGKHNCECHSSHLSPMRRRICVDGSLGIGYWSCNLWTLMDVHLNNHARYFTYREVMHCPESPVFSSTTHQQQLWNDESNADATLPVSPRNCRPLSNDVDLAQSILFPRLRVQSLLQKKCFQNSLNLCNISLTSLI